MDSKKVQNPNRSVDCKRRSAHSRGGTSVRSWLESVRNRALLEETPAVLSLDNLCKDHGYYNEWVSGQEPRLTHSAKSIICKDRQFCTSCRSRVICQFRKQFVFYYAITRIARTRGISSIWKQSGSKLIFRFSIRAKWRHQLSETWAGIFGKWQDWSVSRYALLGRGFHSQSVSPQKCLHRHTFLRIRIRNILRKWQRSRGNMVSSLTSRKTDIATSGWEPK